MLIIMVDYFEWRAELVELQVTVRTSLSGETHCWMKTQPERRPNAEQHEGSTKFILVVVLNLNSINNSECLSTSDVSLKSHIDGINNLLKKKNCISLSKNNYLA